MATAPRLHRLQFLAGCRLRLRLLAALASTLALLAFVSLFCGAPSPADLAAPLSSPLKLNCGSNCSDFGAGVAPSEDFGGDDSKAAPLSTEDSEVKEAPLWSEDSEAKVAPLFTEDPEATVAPLWTEDSGLKAAPLPTDQDSVVKAAPLWTEHLSTSGSSKIRHPSDNNFDNTLTFPHENVVLTKTDEELLYVKREIALAPIVYDDPELYAPLFKNVSIFKRSYELMERMLKVYIYEEGKRPIFHKPELKGIYASEGWFMKLMRENKKFVVKDPSKAHLFYLPYSVRRLEQALFVPKSHNMVDLMIYLRDYINMISTKYTFWNRTHGSDHFLVACHDWGPYTTKKHDELRRNTIKALCNADVSEGIFIRGKDVSLPETTIRSPRRPTRDVGGKPISQRNILAFFAGQMHGRVRPILVQHWSGKDEDMKIYGPLPDTVAKKMSYIQHMKSSKFCICPMGYEVNSPRIVEAIYYECVPVIIADNFVLPFEDVLDWSSFSVVVAEKDIVNLKEMLLKIPERQYITMQMNVKRVKNHFMWHAKPVRYDIFNMILHSIWFSRVNQISIQQ